MRVLTLLLAVFAVASSATAGDDVLRTYQKRYTKDSFLSDREAVLDELAQTADPKALAAFRWCVKNSEDVIAKQRKASDKAYKTLQPIMVKLSARIQKWLDEVTKDGAPIPDKRPTFSPEDDKRLEYQAKIRTAERKILLELDLVKRARTGHGKLVASLPPKDQSKLESAWKTSLGRQKDWSARADEYRLLGAVPTDWALHIVQDAAVEEADPRALAAALEALGGRDAKKVTPILLKRLGDARWLVKVAAIEALERTPSKEGVDALVALMVEGDGRVVDDCWRALKALTGADIRADGDLWRRYWEANRAAWNGPPPPKEERDVTDPMSGIGEIEQPGEEDEAAKQAAADEKGKTGFFGIDVKSRRLVYVIDVSGSMNETEKGAKQPRVDLAKEELKRAVLALEDGALFNILFFSVQVRAWQREMTEANSQTRREAVEFVDGMAAAGGTATYDALKAAFDLGDVGKGKKQEADPSGDAQVDTIILLSDGMPTVGKIVDPESIRKLVREWNATRRIAIHTVSIGDADAAGFMEGIAEDNGGQNVAK